MYLSWKRVLRLLSLLSLIVAVGWVWYEPGFEPVYTLLGAITSFIISFFASDAPLGKGKLPQNVTLFSEECGNDPVDLGNQRLRVSAAFGSYFTSLLEQEQGFINLAGQIDCPASSDHEGLSPIQRLFWHFQNPKGARVIVLAAEGGMGKSTLASKLVRCLYEQEMVDMILGDSAKSTYVDPVTGELHSHTPGYETISAFYQRLCAQVGVPYENDRLALSDIRGRLANRRAVIVVDNLDTIARDDKVLLALQRISNRDVRTIVTTRRVSGLRVLDRQHLLVHLHPLNNIETATDFLEWHINRHYQTHPGLSRLRSDIKDKNNLDRLIEKSGGVPLLMQLLISNVARFSWKCIDRLPHLFGAELLDFLYKERWEELETPGSSGALARKILLWLKQAHYKNKKITSKRLSKWAEAEGQEGLLDEALALLYERFLIINSDHHKGNFAIFPSLVEFLEKQG